MEKFHKATQSKSIQIITTQEFQTTEEIIKNLIRPLVKKVDSLMVRMENIENEVKGLKEGKAKIKNTVNVPKTGMVEGMGNFLKGYGRSMKMNPIYDIDLMKKNMRKMNKKMGEESQILNQKINSLGEKLKQFEDREKAMRRLLMPQNDTPFRLFLEMVIDETEINLTEI